MERIQQLTKELKKEQMDAVFLTSKANLYYYTNIYAEAHERLLALYVDVHGNILLICPSLEKEDVKNAGFTEDVIYYGDHENPWEKLKQKLTGIDGINRLAIEKEVLNVNRFEQLKNVFHTAELVDGQTLLNNIRLIKDDQEYRYLKEAAEYADFAIETALNAYCTRTNRTLTNCRNRVCAQKRRHSGNVLWYDRFDGRKVGGTTW